MIFERSIRYELINIAGIVFGTLFLITVTVMSVKILGQVIDGRASSRDILALVFFQSINYMPIIFILTGFISVLSVVTRSYQDYEMIIWFVSGLSLVNWIKPVLQFGLFIIVVTGLLSFFITPLANQQSIKFRERYKQREEMMHVVSGKFIESTSENRVFFIEKISHETNKLIKVFISTMKNQNNTLLIAGHGQIKVNKNGTKLIVLNQGQRYDVTPYQSAFRIVTFKRYSVSFMKPNSAHMISLNSRSMRTISSLDLVMNNSNSNHAELLWRMALPIMSVILMLLAIPLASINSRVNRSMNLIIALFLFLIYSHMLNIVQSAVAKGSLSLILGWWPIHFGVIIIVIILFFVSIKINSHVRSVTLWFRLRNILLKYK